MPNPEILQLPAAERLVALKKKLLQNTEQSGENDDKIECKCSCHTDPRFVIGGTWINTCKNSVCLGCRDQRTRALDGLHNQLMMQHEVCCTSVSPHYLADHLQGADHLTRVYHVMEPDLMRMDRVLSAVPGFHLHHELWIPLMKAAYGFGVTTGNSVADIRLAYIARQLLVSVDPASQKMLTKLYPSRVARAEQTQQSKIFGNYVLSPTGCRIGTEDVERNYARYTGEPLAMTYWGESYS